MAATKTNETNTIQGEGDAKRSRAVTFTPESYTTFDVNDVQNKLKVFNAHNASASLNQIGEEPFNIVDVMAEPSTRAQSGNPCQNTYIFTDDGRVLFTQSNGIASTINEIVKVVSGDFKANTTNGYVRAHVSVLPLTGNRTYKRLQMDAI